MGDETLNLDLFGPPAPGGGAEAASAPSREGAADAEAGSDAQSGAPTEGAVRPEPPAPDPPAVPSAPAAPVPSRRAPDPGAHDPEPLNAPPPLWEGHEDGAPTGPPSAGADQGPPAEGHAAVSPQPAVDPEPAPTGRPGATGGHAAVAPESRVASGPGSGPDAGGTRPPSSADADAGPRVFTVSQVNRGVRTLLEGSFSQIWVGGEVGRWTRHRSGHCYFTLKDDRAQLRCVMFQSEASRLPMDPDEGMTVRVFGTLTLYEGRGEFQLNVRRLETDTAEGLWRLAFERLRARLDAEGLLAPERKRPLPSYPAAVGVVTSPTGAALRDVLTVVGRRAPWTRVIVRGARVQGEGAAAEVAAAIDAVGQSGLVDVVIVGRGGGSIEDLWAFNEEAVARAIARCPVPVVSGVGHEVDVTIADLVADVRAATPSAAAEAAVPDGQALARALDVARGRLIRGLRGGVEGRRSRVREGVTHLGRAARRLLEPRRQALRFNADRMEKAVRRLVVPRRERVEGARDRMARAMDALLETRRRRLVDVTGTMNALSPLATLTRGYAVPLDDEARVLRTLEAFEPGRRFVLRVVDGRVRCEALETEPEESRGI